MSPLAFLLWVANIASDTAGRLAFKSAAVTGTHASEWQRWQTMLRRPLLWGGIVCFVIEFVSWLALMSLIPLSQGVLISTINIVTVALAGKLIFHERLDKRRAGAIALIAVGVALAGGAP